MTEALGQLIDQLQEYDVALVRGRKVIYFAPVLAAATKVVERHREHGATDHLIITFSDGTGPLPDPDQVLVHYLPFTEPVQSVMDELAHWRASLNSPPAHVLSAIEAFDPAHEAVMINGLPAAADVSAFGRPLHGGRTLADETLEDKALCGELFRRAGVTIADEHVVATDPVSLSRSVIELDRGSGVVVSADASQGMNGGAARVWWIRDTTDRAQVETVLEHAQAAGDRARVMPFLEGQPCSIHGIVTDDGVAVLRPVELCMLRPAGAHTFRQAGISTWWDPPTVVRDQMRDAARAVGELLGAEHDYRGAFGIDGILTADGFRPHELNPRFSGGISAINKGLPQLSLTTLDTLVRSRRTALVMSASDLEQQVLSAADTLRFGSAYLATDSAHPTETATVFVAGTVDELRITDDEVSAVGTLEIGPAAMGALVRYTPLRLAPGERLTPWATAAYQLADRLWDTGFGDLEMPIDHYAHG